MRQCPACGGGDVDASWRCASCLHSPSRIDGFIAFSPELATLSSGFRPEYFQQLSEVEAGNFWFVARNRLIAWAAGRYFRQARNFCEIGCGTGYVLQGIASAFPGWSLSATEIYADGLQFAAARVPRASFYQLDARRIPFSVEFDVIGAFDVLEHIEEDERVLQEMYRAIVPGGGMLITVPQHPFMWSQQDEHACHVRRYGETEIRRKIEAAGFRIEMMTSFVTLLFPLMYLARRRGRLPEAEYDLTADLRLNRFVNGTFSAAMNIERKLIETGARFPFGGSLLVVARKVAGE